MKKCTNLAQQMERAVAAGAGVKQQPRSITTGWENTLQNAIESLGNILGHNCLRNFVLKSQWRMVLTVNDFQDYNYCIYINIL